MSALDLPVIAYCNLTSQHRPTYSGASIQISSQDVVKDGDWIEAPLDGPQITNVELFRACAEAYLRGRRDLRQRRFKYG